MSGRIGYEDAGQVVFNHCVGSHCRCRLIRRVSPGRSAAPRHLAIAAGPAGSGFDNFARQYARILARHGVELEIRNFAGAVENLDRLRDPASGVQAALTAFGVTQPADADVLYSLGGVFDAAISLASWPFQPAW
jgi:hypothetical protein